MSPTPVTLTAYYADKMGCVVPAIYGLYAARASQSGVSSPSVNTSRDQNFIMSEDDSDANSSVGESEGEISEPESKTDLVKIEHLKIIRTIGTGT